MNGKMDKIYRCQITERNAEGPGKLAINERGDQFWVSCEDYQLAIQTLQLEGKKRMETAAFLRGYKESLSEFEAIPKEA